MMMAHKARLAEFDEVLSANKINMDRLQQLCFTGVPDGCGRRAQCWCLLLGYLPPDPLCWDHHLAAKRRGYKGFVDDIIVRTSDISSNDQLRNSNDNYFSSNNTGGFTVNNSNNCGSPCLDLPFSSNQNMSKRSSDESIGSASFNENLSTESETREHEETINSSSTRGEVQSCNEILRSNNSSASSSANVTKNTENLSREGSVASVPACKNVTTVDNTCSDHPLNLSPDSEWQGFFKDNEVLSQIDKDVKRLCPDMCFFQRVSPIPPPPCPRLSARVCTAPLPDTCPPNTRKKPPRCPSPPPPSLPADEEAHWEVVERLLFVYTKLNPGQGYVQGMNEIIGPLYYVLATSTKHAEHAEADCFWLFTALMTHVRDLFIRTLDDSESGISRLMARLMTHLDHHDSETAAHLAQLGIREQYFAFRWLSLLFCQEFPLPDVIRLWDSIFSRRWDIQHGFLLDVAAAMIILQRQCILEGDFAANMHLLQNYPPVDVVEILNKAVQLMQAGEDQS